MRKDVAMDVRIPRLRLTGPTVGAILAAGFGISALSYQNGFPPLAAAAAGVATIAFGVWTAATER
jgi:hypothetical protein